MAPGLWVSLRNHENGNHNIGTESEDKGTADASGKVEDEAGEGAFRGGGAQGTRTLHRSRVQGEDALRVQGDTWRRGA